MSLNKSINESQECDPFLLLTSHNGAFKKDVRATKSTGSILVQDEKIGKKKSMITIHKSLLVLHCNSMHIDIKWRQRKIIPILNNQHAIISTLSSTIMIISLLLAANQLWLRTISGQQIMQFAGPMQQRNRYGFIQTPFGQYNSNNNNNNYKQQFRQQHIAQTAIAPRMARYVHQADYVTLPPQQSLGGKSLNNNNSPPIPQRPKIILVPGAPIKGQSKPEPPILVLPNYNYYRIGNMSEQELNAHSYIIDNKQFVEAVSTRCLASTILEDPDSIEPSFVIIKPQSEIRLNATVPAEVISLAGFDPRMRTTIFIHGFTQSYPNTTWLRRVRGLFEIHSLVPRHNLIIMDWGIVSHGSYSQVAAKVSGMGSFLANFIMKLIDLGADRLGIHLIGHSLGAHLAGFAGKRIRPRLGRITALDPAGPCFGKIISNSPQDRLSADDAFEVDVYHYDDDFLGLPGQHGQFDVYVNGGSSQPGCKDNVNAVFQALITMVFRRNRVLSESHTRSTEVPSVQLSTTNCQQVAYECRDYAAFTLGECGQCDDLNSQCFFMGFAFQYNSAISVLDNNSPRGGANLLSELPLRTSFPGKRLYITTGPNELFCLQHYQILVRFEPNNELLTASKRNKWRLQLELISHSDWQPISSPNQDDNSQTISVITLTNQMAPGIYSYLLLTEAQPFRIKAARLQVRASDGQLVPIQASIGTNLLTLKKSINSKIISPFQVALLETNFMSNIDPNVRRSLSSRLCPLLTIPDGQAPNEANSISESSAQSSEWIYFEECLVRPVTAL